MHGVALGAGAHLAGQGAGVKLAVHGGGAQALHLGAALDGGVGHAIVALQADAPWSHLQAGVGHAPARAVVQGAGVEGAERQFLLVPRAVGQVLQLGGDAPALRARAGLHRALQRGGGGLRPQGGEVHGVQRGLGLAQWLGRPGSDVGSHLGLHGVGCGRRGVGAGAQLRCKLQLCGGAGQGALQRGVRRQRQGLGGAGRSGEHLAVDGGLQLHGGAGLQRGLGAVVALGPIDAADL